MVQRRRSQPPNRGHQMQTNIPDTNSLEIPITSPGGTSGVYRLSPARQTRVAVGRRPFLQAVIGGIAGMMAGAQMGGAAASSSLRGEAEFQQRAVERAQTKTGNTV